MTFATHFITPSSRSTLGIAAAAAGAWLAAASAGAAVLVPGANANIGGWAPAAGGSTIFTQNYNFTAIDVPNGSSAATGVLQQTIVQQLSGELLFNLAITSLAADEGVHVTSVENAGWATFSVDADFLLDSGPSAPGFVARSGFNNGGNVTWSDFSEAMTDGKSSALMQVLTDADGYVAAKARFTISFSDGSRSVLMIAAPSAVPAPGAVLLLLGAIPCAVRRRR